MLADRKKSYSYLIAAALLLATSAPSIAADTASDTAASSTSGSDLAEIVVTAARREQRLLDVPQAVQAVTADALFRENVTDIASAIALIPSATTGATIGAGSTVFQIRGVAASETDGDSTVGYYLDNFAFSMPGRPYAPVTDFYDMNRVEVLRGPSGTLYGLGSLGGTIKVITNDPNLDKFEGSVRAAGSGTAGGDPNAAGDLMLNVPLVPGEVSLRGVLSYKHLGGYATIIPYDEPRGNPANSLSSRIKLLAKLGDRFTVKLAYWGNDSHQLYSDRITFYDPPAVNDTFGIILSHYNLFTADLSYDFGFANLSSTTGDITNTVISNNGGTIPPPTGRFVSIWPLSTKNFNEDLRLTSTSKGPLSYIAGVFYQNGYTIGGQNVALPDFATPGNIGIATTNFNKLTSKSWAVYGEGTYALLDNRLDLTVGGRYYREHRIFDQDSSLQLLGLGVTVPTVGSEGANASTFNPRFNVAYHPADNGTVYVDVAKGFRSGAITSSALIGAANAVLGTHFSNSSPPDTLWNYELGTKWQVFDKALEFEFAAYYFDWKDAQLELSPAEQSIVVPAGNVHGRGLDTAITWNTPLTGLTLQLTGNINQTTLNSVPVSLSAALPFISNGNQLPGSAKATSAFLVNYTAPLMNTGLEAKVNARYTTRSHQQSIYNGAISPYVGLTSLRAGVGQDRWDVALFSDNLANARGPLDSPGGQYQIPFPRVVGLEGEYKF